MSITIDDLKPKSFTIQLSIKNSDEKLSVTCNPPRLSDTLIMTKIGEIFTNPNKFTSTELIQAEKDMDMIIAKLTPELQDVKLDGLSVLEYIGEVFTNSEPDDDKELRDRNVSMPDPKVQKTEETGS